jgi:hypothetical protein
MGPHVLLPRSSNPKLTFISLARGVNMNLPPLNCLANDALAAHASYEMQQMGLPIDARGPASWPKSHKTAAELAYFRKFDACARSSSGVCDAKGNPKMLKAASTNFVVWDMVRTLEALGEEKQGISYWG